MYTPMVRKTLLLIACISTLFFLECRVDRQEESVRQLLLEYEEEPGFFVFGVSTSFLKYVLKSKEQQELLGALERMDKIYLLMHEPAYSQGDALKNFRDELNSYLAGHSFEELAKIENKNEQVSVKIDTLEPGEKKEMVITREKEDRYMLINIYGKMQQEDLTIILNPANLQHLKNIIEKHGKEPI
jgi:hypothetical protein